MREDVTHAMPNSQPSFRPANHKRVIPANQKPSWPNVAMSRTPLTVLQVLGGGCPTPSRGFSKVVATLNHVDGSFYLLWPPPGMSE